MQVSRSSGPERGLLALAIALILAGPARASDEPGAAAGPAAAVNLDDLPSASVADLSPDAPQWLYLEVFLGEKTTGQIVRLRLRLRNGQLSAAPDVLAAVGILLPPGIATDADGLVSLDQVPGIEYSLDLVHQSVTFRVAPSLRPGQTIGYHLPPPVHARRDTGAVVNYDGYYRRSGAQESATLATDLRVFGRFGVLEQTGINRWLGGQSGYQRLDTTWSYSDPVHLWTWAAGDLISGGLSWTRPVRLGGLQWRRNFGTRPDLVTAPIAQFSAQAAVPSSVDLLINNIRQTGGDVQDGPFVINTTPRINGAGTATLVVRDAQGRVTETSVSIYADTQRLAPGLSDFSVEVGRLRRGFGSDSRYDVDWVGSGSVRRGMSRSLTLEAHGESAPGFRLAGVGAVWSPQGRYGLVNFAWARSDGDQAGSLHRVGYQWLGPRLGLDLQSERRSPGYRDLATLGGGLDLRARDQASVFGTFGRDQVSLTWVRWQQAGSLANRTVSASWTRNFARSQSISLDVSHDSQSGNGIGVNFSMPLGPDIDAQLFADHRGGRNSAIADVRRTAPYDGGWGWDVRAGERNGHYAAASAQLRGRSGEVNAGIENQDGQSSLYAQASGGIAWMGGGLAASRPISDSFAMVSTHGIGGVPVSFENRPIGVSSRRGYLLIPDLRSWQLNRVAIDPDALGAGYRLPPIEQRVTPADRAGILVPFNIQPVHPAVVVLLGADGKAVPAGAELSMAGTETTFLVGFDGEAYIDDVKPGAELDLKRAGEPSCRYTLPAALPDSAGAARIGPLSCKEGE